MSSYYMSPHCLHGLHSRCTGHCPVCAQVCICGQDDCGHGPLVNPDADYDLQTRIALALHETPGYHTGTAPPWLAARRVIEELRKTHPRKELPDV